MDKKTSKDWSDYILEGTGITIIDPDGWDRRDWDYSFKKELITIEEFKKRVSISTCIFYPSPIEAMKDMESLIKKYRENHVAL